MRSNGFTLIEVLLALALTALVVTGIVDGLLISGRSLTRASHTVDARLRLEECQSVVRWIRDENGVGVFNDNVRGIRFDQSIWTLSTEVERIDDQTRQVSVEQINSDSVGVECSVWWDDDGRTASISAFSILSK